MEIQNARGEQLEEILLMPYSHNDFAWTNLRQWHIWRYIESTAAVLDLMKVNSDYTFIIDNVIHSLSPFIKYCPDRVDELKERIREGRIYIANGGYSLARPNYIGEESYIRNLVEGKRFFKNLTGKPIDFVYNVDTCIGHSQMPQILKLSGHKYYRFFRPQTTLDYKKVPKEFIWKGLDGSEVIVSRGEYCKFVRAHYTNMDYSNQWDEISKAFYTKELADGVNLLELRTLFLSLGGDDIFPLHNLFDEPVKIVDFIEEWNKRENTRIRFACPDEYFKKLESQDLSRWDGVVEQCELSYNAPTMGNRSMYNLRYQLDRAILNTEKTCSIAAVFGFEYPYKQIQQLWLDLFEITGHAISFLLEKDFSKLYSLAEGALHQAGRIVEQAEEFICMQVEPDSDNQYILINTLAYDRDEIINMHITSAWGVSGLELMCNGNKIDYQVTEIYTGDKFYQSFKYNGIDISFRAKVPAMGYAVINARLSQAYELAAVDQRYLKTAPASVRYRDENYIIDNGAIVVAFNKGLISSIKDKNTDRVLTSNSKGFISSLRYVSVKPSTDWTASWDKTGEFSFEPDEYYVINNGPYEYHYRSIGTIGCHKARLDYIIKSMEKAVHFEAAIESYDGEGYFTADFACDKDTQISVDVPFGWEHRDLSVELLNTSSNILDSANLLEQGYKGQYFGKTWTSFNNKEISCAVVQKNCSIYFNHETESDIISLFLNRQVVFENKSFDQESRWFLQTPETVKGTGKNTYRYALLLSDNVSEITRFSYEQQFPIRTVPKYNRFDSHTGLQNVSILRINSEQLSMTSFYMEMGCYYLRLYENSGNEVAAEISISIPFTTVFKTNLMHDTQEQLDEVLNGKIYLKVKPFEIINLKIIPG